MNLDYDLILNFEFLIRYLSQEKEFVKKIINNETELSDYISGLEFLFVRDEDIYKYDLINQKDNLTEKEIRSLKEIIYYSCLENIPVKLKLKYEKYIDDIKGKKIFNHNVYEKEKIFLTTSFFYLIIINKKIKYNNKKGNDLISDYEVNHFLKNLEFINIEKINKLLKEELIKSIDYLIPDYFNEINLFIKENKKSKNEEIINLIKDLSSYQKKLIEKNIEINQISTKININKI